MVFPILVDKLRGTSFVGQASAFELTSMLLIDIISRAVTVSVLDVGIVPLLARL